MVPVVYFQHHMLDVLMPVLKYREVKLAVRALRASVDSTINHIIRQSAVTAITHTSIHTPTQVWKPSVIVQLVLHHIFFHTLSFSPCRGTKFVPKSRGGMTPYDSGRVQHAVYSYTTKSLNGTRKKQSAS